jgi:hypothetical protein
MSGCQANYQQHGGCKVGSAVPGSGYRAGPDMDMGGVVVFLEGVERQGHIDRVIFDEQNFDFKSTYSVSRPTIYTSPQTPITISMVKTFPPQYRSRPGSVPSSWSSS